MNNIDVTIENFGKIQHAQFQVKPFTVIAGKNASGKSFITRALYSVFNTLNKDHFAIEIDEHIFQLQQIIGSIALVYDEPDGSVKEHIQKIVALNLILSRNVELIIHQSTLIGQLAKKDTLELNIQQLKEECNVLLKSVTAIDEDAELLIYLELLNEPIEELGKLILNPFDLVGKVLGLQLKSALFSNFQVNVLHKLKNKNATSKTRPRIYFDNDIGHLELLSDHLKYNLGAIGIDVFQQIDNVVYLESPIYWKIKDVLKGWVNTQNDPSQRRQRKHQQKELKKIPQYILDTFALLDVDVIQDEVFEELVELKNKINKCIGGQIQISQSGDLQFISQNQKGESFGVDLNQTASGTTSLGLISLLLEKNVIVPNSVLIMDEPEVNLHPAWQQVMIQVLYQLSVSGVKIIMASHSFDMMETIEKMMELHEEKGLDVGEHFSVVQLDDGNTINQDKPIFKKLDAVKADLGMPLYNLFADK
jgi:predicted ATPase